MLILGLSGGQALPQEVSPVLPTWQHDTAAVLIEDGRVVAAIEEERLNRIKHTNRAPLYATRFCLRQHGITGQDLDHVAFYWDDAALDRIIKRNVLRQPQRPMRGNARDELRDLCATHLAITLPPDRFHFVRHHLAHAVSAFAQSDFERSLIVTLDGEGDRESGLVAIGDRATGIAITQSFAIRDSLGYFYQETIGFLGYTLFDEYKVMGLAPYGDPARYRSAFDALYTLLPAGGWQLHRDQLVSLYDVITPRRKGQEITQAHMDFAAGLQAALERIVFHLLTYQQHQTGERNLCLAGGVAHNCTVNGKVLASGLFERVFIQPAAHDAGAALGAALHVYQEQSRTCPRRCTQSLAHLYWGRDINVDGEIASTLTRWRECITVERVDDICRAAASLMADGHVIGWAQGRSEFGPRALGNRSIVADPRPAANKARINAMVKKREAFRPFAPAVLVEAVHEYFDLPPGVTELPYMIAVVNVREDKRPLLGAVTHVDGSARVQTVSRHSNAPFWHLIKAFQDITGVPVVLNTSFNNNAEPIVESAEDALVCFLTTGLEYLAIGDWLVRKGTMDGSSCQTLVLSIPPHYRLTHTRLLDDTGAPRSVYHLMASYDAEQTLAISPATYEVLLTADGQTTVANLCAAAGYDHEQTTGVLTQLYELWQMRAVSLTPHRRPDATI